ncbi:50S ribosome-binding GTPase, partial [Selenomonadales bacterium OttesenSCG-928-I06]|nr:50S ribosome-binding GTPase [Selenomonadales bacterium OttesenSCG-928-I06]
MSTNLEVGIIGLTNIGKSALFNAMTKSKAETVNYPFSTVKPNIGIVEVPDSRLDVLAEMHNPKKITPTSIKFVDLAGLVEGAATGEGLGNKFLSYIRQVDAVCHVVRCFEDENIAHVGGSIDPVRDIEIINTELCLADLESIEKRIEKAQKQKKSGDKKAVEELAVLEKVRIGLENAEPARNVIEE